MAWKSTPLQQRWTQYLLRGCSDPADPEQRRRAAVLTTTALTSRVIAAVFIVINLLNGNYGIAGVALTALLATWLAVLIHHRTCDPLPGERIGVAAAGGLFLYLLASGGDSGTGYVWLPILPLLAIIVMGRRSGTVVSVIYIALAVLIMLVPGLPGVTADYPVPLALRLAAATIFSGIIAFYFDSLGQHARARLREEIEVRSRAEQELRASEEEAVRSSRAKSDFLATLSHEVRTPLTAIMAVNDALLQTKLDDEQLRLARLTAQSGRSLVRMMGDILDLAKVEAGALTVESVVFDLRELMTQVVEIQRAQTADRPISVTLDWHPDVPRVVAGDPARLRQVLINLTSNALKFTHRGSIVVRARCQDQAGAAPDVLFSVEDSGVGLPEELHEAVFQPFERGEATRGGGSGLGLAISRRLVHAMGGAIGVHSRPGEGANFWFTLPLPVVQKAGNLAPTPAAARFTGRVLLVEDNDLNREVLRMMLERLGCSVQTAPNGWAGVAAFVEGRFDLVLMDCRMPKLDGYAAAGRIREHENGDRRTPIVAITAHTLPEDVRRSLDAGMDDHLGKPVLPEDMIAMLARWLPREDERGPTLASA